MKLFKRLEELEPYNHTFIGFKRYDKVGNILPLLSFKNSVWVFTLNLYFCILEYTQMGDKHFYVQKP